MTRLLTVAQAAEVMQVHERTVRRLIWGHHLRHHRIGQAIRIPQEALAEYLRTTEVVPC